MDKSVVSIVVAVLALVGVIYTGITSRAAARETARQQAEAERERSRVPTFEAITTRLDLEREKREREITELTDKLSSAEHKYVRVLAYVRELRDAFRRCSGEEPPPPPPDLELIHFEGW